MSLVLAVATTPELLICDDPALGLDVVMRRELLDALIDLIAEPGCSVLEQAPFAPDAESISSGYPIPGKVHLVFERSSRKLWKLDWGLGNFVPLTLPNGEAQLDVLSTSSKTELFGAQHVCELANDRFERLRSNSVEQEPPRAPNAPEDLRARVQSEADLMSPILRVLDAEGTPIFGHAYAPRTPGERWSAGALLAASFARPRLSATAHLGAAPMETRNPLVDPLVAGGRRTWLVALHCGFGVLCAAIARGRLRRIGDDRRTR